MTKTNKPAMLKIMLIVVLLFIGVSIIFYFNQPESNAAYQKTDNAYVQADITFVSPQISGILKKIYIKDNEPVKAGDLLATIDDYDFKIAVSIEESKVNSAKANIGIFKAKMIKQKNSIKKASVQLEISEDNMKLAQANFIRYKNLAKDGASSVQKLQQARNQLNVSRAKNEKNKLLLEESRLDFDILVNQHDKASSQLELAESSLAFAKLKLSYTRIVATTDGIIGKKNARNGAYVTPNSLLFAIVPIDKVYIHANYRETQLAKVASGDSVNIEIDAFPNQMLEGYVESLAPASTLSYSAIAPSNATGNFTKIVQRIPVRIQLLPDQALSEKLRVGMSVITNINVSK